MHPLALHPYIRARHPNANRPSEGGKMLAELRSADVELSRASAEFSPYGACSRGRCPSHPRQPSLNLLHVLRGGEVFRLDPPRAEHFADRVVVFDVLAGDLGFRVQIVALDAGVRDLVGDLFRLERDRRQEVGERPALGHAEPLLHRAGGDAAEQGLVALRADPREAPLVLDPLVDQARQDLLRSAQLAAGGEPFRIAVTRGGGSVVAGTCGTGRIE